MKSINHILVDFDLVFDTDIGLINTIKDKYNNPVFINSELLNNISQEILIIELLSRDNENPISVIIRDSYKEQINQLREQFISEEYDYILSKSIKTEIYTLIEMYSKSNLVIVDILCKNKQEELIIKNLNIKLNAITKDIPKIDISAYDSIFVKRYKDILKFPKLSAKNIYIGNYKFNMEANNDNLPLLDVSMYIADVNEIHVLNVYDNKYYKKILG